MWQQQQEQQQGEEEARGAAPPSMMEQIARVCREELEKLQVLMAEKSAEKRGGDR